LTSMMFTTGEAGVGQMHPDASKALFAGSPPETREEAIAQSLRRASIVRSPAYPTAPEAIAEIAGLAWERGHDQVAIARQAVAVVASGDRSKKLRELSVPALVLHGTHDVICDVSGGKATAAAIPGAELVLIEGMGHDIPAALWERIAGHIMTTIRRGEA